MKPVLMSAILGCILLLPEVGHAQRFGYSIGMPAAGAGRPAAGASASSSSLGVQTPTLPLLPSPFPAAPAVATPSLSLQPLNLESMHLVPPPILVLPSALPGKLPQVPFALDPILRAPQICVDPAVPNYGK